MAPATHPPTNLPAETTSFVGRRQEMADVRRGLSASRLVTLTGAGGVGKTRLALKVAGTLRSGFDDGVWLVELASLRDPDDLEHAVADVLGLRATPGTSLASSLAAHLAPQHTLVLLDNCEHLVDRVTPFVHDLLRRCPGLHVLATSREPFGLVEEFVVPVPTLPFPDRDSAPTPDTLARFDSVDLFVERAAAGCPGFALTPENTAAVVTICSALEGIPLAIELAAVRVRSLPLDAILDRLNAHPSRPGREPHRSPNHHRTLRASVEWSHGLCTPHERTLWARLSVFSGGFDLDAAHAICGDPDSAPGHTTDTVVSLVEKSILIHEPSATGGRYRMLETLRAFGEERLATDPADAEATVARHLAWFAALAESASAGWLGCEQAAVVVRLQAEYGNLRAAFTRSLSGSGRPPHALVIAAALEHYWLIRGWQSEGRQWLDEALRAAPFPSAERARALRVNAYLTALQGETDAAAAMAAEARAIAGELGDLLELGYVTRVEGVIELCTGHVAEARARLETAVADFHAQQDAFGEAYTLNVLASVAAAMEDTRLAEDSHRRCMDLTEPVGESYMQGFSLWGRGIAALRDGDIDGALELERGSLRLKRHLHDQLGVVLCIEALAWIDIARGEYERAAVLLGGSQRLWSPMRMTIGAIVDFGRFGTEYEQLLEQRLGARRLDAARRRGSRMNVEQVMDMALGEAAPEPADATPLTRREMEIAQLVARGLTNRRIALDLTLSQRTVEGHVEKIMSKMGFTSRTQIAAWTAELRATDDVVHGLTG